MRECMRSILVVEDDAAVASWLARLLQREGYVVRVASSLASASAELSKVRPDLIILDLVLPDGLGISLLPRLEAHSRVLLISGHASAEVRSCLREPFSSCAFLPKPIDTANLLEETRTLLSAYRAIPFREYRDTMRAVVAGELTAILGDDPLGAAVLARAFGDKQPIRSAASLASACGYTRGGLYSVWRQTWPVTPHEIVLFALVTRAVDLNSSQRGRTFPWKRAAVELRVGPRRLRHGFSILLDHPLLGRRVKAELAARGFTLLGRRAW